MRIKKLALSLAIINLFMLAACSKQNDNKYTGTLECDEFYLTSEVSGKIKKIEIKQGDEVNKNKLAAKIDSRQYMLQKAQALGAYETARANYDQLPDEASDNQKKQLNGAIKQAKAQVDLAQLSIDKCNLLIPNSGIVSEVFFQPGELVQSGSNIAKVEDIKNKYIKIYVEQSKRKLVKLKGRLKLYYGDKKIGFGTVTYISPEAEFTPKNTETKSDKENTVFEVKIQVPKAFDYSPGTLIDVEVK